MLKSILKYTCPRCRSGNMFFKPFSLDTAYKMNDVCSVCKQSFMPEPGFYYGGMFLSYILSGFTLVGIALVMVFVLHWDVNMSLVFIVILGALLHNFFFRLSRSIWIHMMVRYRGLPNKQPRPSDN